MIHLTLKEGAKTIHVLQTTASSMSHKLYDAINLLKKLKLFDSSELIPCFFYSFYVYYFYIIYFYYSMNIPV